LARRCDCPALIDETLDWLASLNYLNDERYAEAFIRSALMKGRGPLRIKRELQQKGVAPAIINHAFDVAEIDWWQQAQELWQRKFGTPPEDAKTRAKQIRFMLYRGFSLDLVNDIINGADRYDY
ncbi:MAG TPA: regulatory protein RecX, partial [Cellvibrionaceae bacterium]